MLKRYWFIVFVVVILVVSGCSNNDKGDNEGETTSDDTEAITLSLGHVNDTDHQWNVGAQKFAEEVEEATDGQVIIEIHDSGKLGGELEMIEQLQLGDLDMAIIAGGSHLKIVPETAIEELPFLFSDHEAAYEAMDGELGDRIIKLLEEEGIKGLAFWEEGFFQVTNNKGPITELNDFDGLKIRVPENEIRIDIFKALGANPIPMSFTELFTALQQNVVDGQTNPLPVIEASKFDEVQDYATILNVNWGSGLLEMNLDTWNNLPENVQTVLQEKALEVQEFERELSREKAAENLQILEERGMEINEVEDMTPFIEAVQPVYEKYEDIIGKELMDLVVPE